ncbi:MAG: TonB-dependent receptor [Tannerella sp.]|nr:TonB-dependent receptor [Tannerella sp.]
MQKRWIAKLSMCFMSAWFVSFTVVSAQNNRQADTVKSRQLPEVEIVTHPHTSVTRQATPLQILDGKSIVRLGIQDLSEAVRRFSGLTVKDYGGIGGLKTVSIRSLGAHHTAVSYDGVAISDAQSGQVDISRFTLDNIDMISLSVGQSDEIFQTARVYASAGTLNIKTQKPRFASDNTDLLTVKIKSGSFGLIHPVFLYSRKLHRRWSTSVYADYMRADSKYPYTLVNGTIKTREKRMNSDIETLRMEGNIYGDFGRRGGRFETKLYTFHSERGLPGSVNFYNKTATERLWNDNSFVQAGYKNQWDERFAVQAFAKYAYAYSRYKDVNDKYSAGYQEDRNTQHEYYASAGVRYTPLDVLSASFTTDYAHTTLHNNFVNAAQPRRNTSLTVFAVQYKSNRFTATGSALGTYISDKVEYGDHPADRKHLSPAAAFSWQPTGRNALRIRVSYKDIFRAPTFTDLYYLRMGNTGLKPEKAKQYNAGLTWSGNIGRFIRYLRLSVDGYYNKVEDKIIAFPTLYIWKMMNMGEVEIKGADVNLSAEIPLSGNINTIISGSYTCQYAIDITNPDAKNYRHQIPYTPRHAGNGSVTVEMPWINISWLFTAVGERYALPQNTDLNRVDAYAEQSISLNRTFKWRNASLRLQGEILNLADTQYDVIQYYPMPGRSWRLSVTLNI